MCRAAWVMVLGAVVAGCSSDAGGGAGGNGGASGNAGASGTAGAGAATVLSSKDIQGPWAIAVDATHV